MAEAAVEDSAIQRFFCHKCSIEIPRVLPDFTCPTCCSGFIEELEAPPDLSDAEMDVEDVPALDLLNQRLGEELSEILLSAGGFNEERRVHRGRDREGVDSRRPGRYGGILPRERIIRNRQARGGRQMAPIETLIQDFIVNLTAGGGPWQANVGVSRGGNTPVFFLGNPGDYAWGREGLDAIVTQLLNQMDSSGPPPLAKDKIKEIPIVVILQDQVDKCLQCSVCWEDFHLDEPVRKLPCEHVYHENCIIPWLELHGTCPVCRKTLGDDGLSSEDSQENMATNTVNQMGPSLAAFFRAANNSGGSRNSSTSSASSSSSGSTTGGSTTSSHSHSRPSSDFNMDLEFD